MFLTKEDLNAIEGLFSKRFDTIDKRFESIDKRLDNLEQDVKVVKVDMLENNVIPRLDNLEQDVRVIKVGQMENNVIPRLSTIEQCYLDTSRRYTESADRFDSAITDIEVMKLAIQKNSSDIRELQRKQA